MTRPEMVIVFAVVTSILTVISYSVGHYLYPNRCGIERICPHTYEAYEQLRYMRKAQANDALPIQ